MNPELQRNLWLEASPRRLVWVGATVGIVYFAALLLSGSFGGPGGALRALQYVGVGLFLIATLIWGMRDAAQAVTEEIGQRTWDFQRLSALTPWSMTWGKLLGATAVPWMVAAAGLAGATPGLIQQVGVKDWAELVVLGLGSALVVQAGAMALVLVSVRKARAEGRLTTMRGVARGLFGFVACVLLIGKGASMSLFNANRPAPQAHLEQWWGMHFDPHLMTALGAAIFGGWALLAAWRLMRLELQMENGPWAWALFLIFTALYFAGFASAAGPATQFAVAALVFAVGAYAAAFAEPIERVRIRHFGAALKRRDLGRILVTAPAVISPVKLMALAVIGFSLSPASPVAAHAPSAPFGFAALAFLVRDLGVIAFFRFGPRPGRGDLAAVVGLVLLYGVGGAIGGAFGHEQGRALFFPSPFMPMVSVIAGALQAAVIWVLAAPRIRMPEQRAA